MVDKSGQEKSIARPEVPLSNPFAVMRRLSDDMERIFEDNFGLSRLPRLFRAPDLPVPRWNPEIEVFKRGDELVVRADLPGMAKESIKVEVMDGTLMIQGERKEEKEQKEKGYYLSERSYGSFYRTVPLPDGVKGDEAKATFKEGVLEIVMPAPKAPEKHGRQLEVK